MAMKWQVITGTYLPRTKRIFDCYCTAISYIKEVLSKSPPELNQEDLERCIKMIRLDETAQKIHDRLFVMTPDAPPYERKDEEILEESV